MITTEPNKERNVYSTLREMEDIIDVHPLFGEYDIIVKVETSTFEKLGKIVAGRIRAIDGVLDTKTLNGIS